MWHVFEQETGFFCTARLLGSYRDTREENIALFSVALFTAQCGKCNIILTFLHCCKNDITERQIEDIYLYTVSAY